MMQQETIVILVRCWVRIKYFPLTNFVTDAKMMSDLLNRKRKDYHEIRTMESLELFLSTKFVKDMHLQLKERH